MRIQRRTRRDSARIAAWLVAALLFVVGAALRDARVLVVALPVAVVLVALTRRRKAAPAAGALYTASADRVLTTGTRQAGQISLTGSSLVWTPSRSAARGGGCAFVATGHDLRSIRLRRGAGLADMVVNVTPGGQEEIELVTRSSRRLEAELARLSSASGRRP